MDTTAELAREFERESSRIDQLIWDAMALRAGESVLFCGCANNIDWIRRAAAVGVKVSVIASEIDGAEALDLPVTIVRGSTSMVPARDAAYDVTVAFHYLHEIDPFFHANVVTELARVAKRLVIVEPAPPSDPLGHRIAALYSRAKRELGQFEQYHPIDYWRKLVAIVKPELTYQTFAYLRTPPRYAIRETVALILDTMAAQATPKFYLDELRALAKRPDAQLVPQARFVIVGATAGVATTASAGAGTPFRERTVGERPATIASPFVPPVVERAPLTASTPAPRRSKVYSTPDPAADLPVVPPVPPPSARPAAREVEAAASAVARNAFGLPLRGGAERRPEVVPSVKGDADGARFGPPTEAVDAAEEYGWEWETGAPK